jgi:single-stranded-DNA-specific exonuclease
MFKKWKLNQTENVEREFPDSDVFHDPFLMKGMSEAVMLIKSALADGSKITVYGDYDCDGVTSAVMLYSYLTALGGEVSWHIPTREEGYGLNIDAVHRFADDGTKLIITVDNGVSAAGEADLVAELGMKLIITDHHTVPEQLPRAAAIINPKQPGCDYPFKELAGCGVVLKLITALEDADAFGAIEQYGDLAAIGTIADIVSLTGENRAIVSQGLGNIACSENIGLHCLMKAAGIEIEDGEPPASMTMAFTVCPRINAAGRFSDASKAVELLLCENHEIAAAKAQELNALNLQRGEEERRILAQIDEYLSANPALLNERMLFLASGANTADTPGWHHGVIGIIASRMVNRTGKSCAVITRDGDCARGSMRSVGEFSSVAALTYSADLLTKFGGHAGAGGFSLESANVPAFKQRLAEYAATLAGTPTVEISADCCPSADTLTLENIEALELLQPFGEGNPVPVFCMTDCRIKHKRPLKEGKYVSFTCEYLGREYKFLNFASRYADFWYKVGDTVDIMANIDVNEWAGARSISIKVIDMRLSGLLNGAAQDRVFAAKEVYEAIKRGEKIDEKLYPRIIPGDSDLKAAYNLIKDTFCLDEVVQRGILAGRNYCMLRIIVDVFAEVGLIEFEKAGCEYRVIKGIKADLSKSEVLTNLKETAGVLL